MKRWYIALVFSALCWASLCSGQNVFPPKAVLDTSLLELPSLSREELIIVHRGYTVSFNRDLLIPNWSAYELTREKLEGRSQRKNSFRRDKDYPFKQASNADYTRSGYDRGHMAPAADMKSSDTLMMESFYFTNICPQRPLLNQRYWLAMEELVRNATVKYGKVWVISGAIVDADSTRFIGKNNVCVPDKFYKAILAFTDSGYVAIAFLMRNDESVQTIEETAMSVDDVEAIVSLDLFTNLKKEDEAAEREYHLSDWGYRKIEN